MSTPDPSPSPPSLLKPSFHLAWCLALNFLDATHICYMAHVHPYFEAVVHDAHTWFGVSLKIPTFFRASTRHLYGKLSIEIVSNCLRSRLETPPFQHLTHVRDFSHIDS